MSKSEMPEIGEWQLPDLTLLNSLMDNDDEAFLREKLPRAAFFHLKRFRIRMTWKYVRLIAHASARVRLSAARARQYPDINVAMAAREAVDLASKLRVQCRIALAKLAVEYIFPRIYLRRDKN